MARLLKRDLYLAAPWTPVTFMDYISVYHWYGQNAAAAPFFEWDAAIRYISEVTMNLDVRAINIDRIRKYIKEDFHLVQ